MKNLTVNDLSDGDIVELNNGKKYVVMTHWRGYSREEAVMMDIAYESPMLGTQEWLEQEPYPWRLYPMEKSPETGNSSYLLLSANRDVYSVDLGTVYNTENLFLPYQENETPEEPEPEGLDYIVDVRINVRVKAGSISEAKEMVESRIVEDDQYLQNQAESIVVNFAHRSLV